MKISELFQQILKPVRYKMHPGLDFCRINEGSVRYVKYSLGTRLFCFLSLTAYLGERLTSGSLPFLSFLGQEQGWRNRYNS
jgi:hypothetical protein